MENRKFLALGIRPFRPVGFRLAGLRFGARLLGFGLGFFRLSIEASGMLFRKQVLSNPCPCMQKLPQVGYAGLYCNFGPPKSIYEQVLM